MSIAERVIVMLFTLDAETGVREVHKGRINAMICWILALCVHDVDQR